MSYSRFLLVLALLGGFSNPLLAQSPKKSTATKPQPHQKPPAPNPFVENAEWRRWKERFASASPLLTLNKMWPKEVAVSDENLKLVLQRKTLIKFPTPLRIADQSLTKLDLSEIDTAIRFDVYDQLDQQEEGKDPDQALKEEERFKKMIEFMEDMIGKREPDELIIQFVGATHGIDLFFDFFLKDSDKTKLLPFLSRRKEVVYTAAPFKMTTERYPAEFHQLSEAVTGIPSKPVTFADSGAIKASVFLSRLYFYQNLLREKLTIENLKWDEASLGTIVVLDSHNFDESEHLSALPSAAALRDAGIKKVKLGNEGWKYGSTYTLEQLRRSAMTPQQGAFEDYEVKLLKDKKPKWHARYEEGVIADSAAYALYRKLKTWSDAGIQISITGLEEFENIGK